MAVLRAACLFVALCGAGAADWVRRWGLGHE